MNNELRVIEKDGETILKDGRKTYATICYNQNPDYKWVLYTKGGLALSGYETKEEAISRAQKMFNDWRGVVSSLIS